MHAFGGYLEGFLPVGFAIEAVTSDERILSFLKRVTSVPRLRQTKKTFELVRGDSVVNFEAAADVPMPKWPVLKEPQVVAGLDLKLLDAMLLCVPKTGFGNLNPEMLGAVLTDRGAISTDNATLAWITSPTFTRRMILPRPFCLALLTWADALGTEFELRHGSNGVEAVWKEGAKLFGVLPSDKTEPMNIGSILDGMEAAATDPIPGGLKEAIEEAAIFSDTIILDGTKAEALHLSTPNDTMSWSRSLLWKHESDNTVIALNLARLKAALKHADLMLIDKHCIYLGSESGSFLAVIAAHAQEAK